MQIASGDVINTLRPRQNARQYAKVSNRIFWNGNCCGLILISFQCVPRGTNNNDAALFNILIWCRTCNKPLSIPMLFYHQLTNARIICIVGLKRLQRGTLSPFRLLRHVVSDPSAVESPMPEWCCSLSSKDDAVIWESFGQVGARCLTTLGMAVDVRRYPHPLVIQLL